MDCAFCVLSKYLCLTQLCEDFLLFSSSSFIVLSFMFKYIIHLKWTFMGSVRVKVHIFFPHIDF